VNALIEGLSFIIQRFKAEDLQKKLTQQFMAFDTNIFTNVELTITLMKRGIISTAQWDSQVSFYIRDNQQFQPQEQFFIFIKEFLEFSIQKQKIFGYHHFPNLMAVIGKISENP
jgi:hypothetical protein